MTDHVIDPTRIHHDWDCDLEPTLRIASGDVVQFDLLMAGHGQVDKGTPIEEGRFDFDTLYNLLGPIWVEGAEPGDTLEIGCSRCSRASGAGRSCCRTSACCRRTPGRVTGRDQRRARLGFVRCRNERLSPWERS